MRSLIERREFLALLCCAGIAYPTSVVAEGAGRKRLIAALLAANPNDRNILARLAAFRKQLGALGWTEGEDLEIDLRWSGGDAAQARKLANEIAGLSPDLIVAHSTLGIEAMRAATGTIPIVFVMVGNPVGAGFVPNFQHPGGNITGFSAFEPEIAGKWMQSLKEIAPQTRQVTILSYPDYEFLWPGAEKAAAALSVEAVSVTCRSAADIEKAMAALEGRPANGLILWPAPLFSANRNLIVRLAAGYKLPAVYPFRYYTAAGGLMSYGIDVVDIFRRAALYVDRILKGENPGDLPVQAPTKFELAINLKTAKGLGLTVPPTLLASADDLIE